MYEITVRPGGYSFWPLNISQLCEIILKTKIAFVSIVKTRSILWI